MIDYKTKIEKRLFRRKEEYQTRIEIFVVFLFEVKFDGR
jgi:hypothetical protein